MPGLFDGTSLERPVTCERCRKPLADCGCPRDASGNLLAKGKLSRGTIAPKVRREKRRGKWNTVVSELGSTGVDRKSLLKDLRSSCGTGGGVSKNAHSGEDELVLQGDHKDAVISKLRELGYDAKGAGG